jgi:hypothetical protein
LVVAADRLKYIVFILVKKVEFISKSRKASHNIVHYNVHAELLKSAPTKPYTYTVQVHPVIRLDIENPILKNSFHEEKCIFFLNSRQH